MERKFASVDEYATYLKGRFDSRSQISIREDSGDFYAVLIKSCGTEFHMKNAMFHRLDGPAVIYTGGCERYFIENIEISKEEEYNLQVLDKVQKFIRHTHNYEDMASEAISFEGDKCIAKITMKDGSSFIYHGTTLVSIAKPIDPIDERMKEAEKQLAEIFHIPILEKTITFDGDDVYYKVTTKYNTCYYKNFKLHREDGPACDFSNGYMFFFINGVMIEERHDLLEQFQNNTLDYSTLNVREQYMLKTKIKPDADPIDEKMKEVEKKIYNTLWHRASIKEKTITFDGDDVLFTLTIAGGNVHYYKNFKLHREDGPAIVGKLQSFYYIDGVEIKTRKDLLRQFQDNTLEYSTLNIAERDFIKRSISPCKARAKILAMYECPQYYNGKVYMCNNGKDIIQALPGSKEFIFAKARYDLGDLLEEFKRS